MVSEKRAGREGDITRWRGEGREGREVEISLPFGGKASPPTDGRCRREAPPPLPSPRRAAPRVGPKTRFQPPPGQILIGPSEESDERERKEEKFRRGFMSFRNRTTFTFRIFWPSARRKRRVCLSIVSADGCEQSLPARAQPLLPQNRLSPLLSEGGERQKGMS